jgi:hypothetical protein
METGTSIKVTYWAEQKVDAPSIHDFEGIDEFRKELAESYISAIHGRPGGLGGLHELIIELVSNISLFEIAKLIAAGVAYDLIKSGSKAFVLRPFLAAYKKLKERNKSYNIDISEIRVVLEDSILIIYKICDDGIVSQLENIFTGLAIHYSNLVLSSGERPFEIHIPIFEDTTSDRLSRFRVLLDVDETIRGVKSSDYFNLWGLCYDYLRNYYRVYDVRRKLLIDEGFYTQQRYWSEWEKKRK